TIALVCREKATGKHARLHRVGAATSAVPHGVRESELLAPGLGAAPWPGRHRRHARAHRRDAVLRRARPAARRRDARGLAELDLGYAILDEAQHIKNPLSQTARAAKRLKAERRLALTGTPIENRLSEIWSIFDFVSPGLLGGLKSFEETYARPIDRGDQE